MDISTVRKQLKYALLARDTHCLGCEGKLSRHDGIDMHEGIFSRAQIQGLPRDKRILFFVKYNCILLCHDCNVNRPPSREAVYREMVSWYGNEFLEWYEVIRDVFKSPPGRIHVD